MKNKKRGDKNKMRNVVVGLILIGILLVGGLFVFYEGEDSMYNSISNKIVGFVSSNVIGEKVVEDVGEQINLNI